MASVAPTRSRTATVEEPSREPAAAPETRPGTTLDESRLHPCYANFCSVRRTIEEVVLDFGMTTEFMGPNQRPVVLEQRVVVSYYTAKRLMEALRVSLQQHEAVFGSVELDARKRAKLAKQESGAVQSTAHVSDR